MQFSAIQNNQSIVIERNEQTEQNSYTLWQFTTCDIVHLKTLKVNSKTLKVLEKLTAGIFCCCSLLWSSSNISLMMSFGYQQTQLLAGEWMLAFLLASPSEKSGPLQSIKS